MSVFHLERSLIRVSGPDRLRFLQDLITQNVEDYEGPRYGALLNPQGKVIADFLIWAVDGCFVLETDLRFGENLLRRLTLYKLRAQVDIEAVSDLGVIFSDQLFEGGLPDPRLPGGALGYRKLAPRAETLKLHAQALAYSRLALSQGVPDLAWNVKPEEVFAGEALLEELHGVDFHKGCFVGQENVSRMKRRATTRRKLCRIAFAGERIDADTPIRAGDAEIGSVRATAFMRGFALLRLDRALEARDMGIRMEAAGREIQLDPPDWLILPSREEA